MDTAKTGLFCLVWTFVVLMIYMIVNTMLFGYVIPVFDDMAYDSRDNITGGFVNYERYQSRSFVVEVSFNVAMFILVLVPYAYLFVRYLFKREPTTQPVYPGGGSW